MKKFYNFSRFKTLDQTKSQENRTGTKTSLNSFIVLLFVCLQQFSVSMLNAQVSGYTFTQTAGTYTPISGGTNYNNFTNWTNTAFAGTLPNATAGFLDDNVSAALEPIGFNFVYNGVTYTQFGICTNGWISLGALPVNSTAPISTGTSNNIIAAMGADIIGRGSFLANRTLGSAVITITAGDIAQISVGDKVSGTGIPAGATVVSKTATTVTISAAATTTGTGFHFRFSSPSFGIRYQTIGTAPNRTLVVQWTGWQRYTTTGGFGELYDFQIRLNETSNAVDVVYNIKGPTSATAATFQVGLRGNANTDFNNRTSTTTWAATTAGTLNSSSVSLSNTVRPATGLTFTWTPPSCVGPSGLTSSAITYTSATISWSAPTPAPSAGYDYFVSTSPTAPTGASLPTGSTASGVLSANLTGLIANTTYYYWVRSNCGGTQSGWVGSSFYTGYCIPTNTTTGDYISSFSTTGGTTNVSTSGTSTAALEDYTAQVITSFAGGVVSFSGAYVGGSAGFSIWIDWNNDLVFDPSELMYNAPAIAASWTGTVTVPAGQALGNYRMRIRARWNAISPPACGAVGYGQAEDYTFTVSTPPSCLAPTALVSSNITSTSATISWTDPSPAPSAGYQYYFSTSATAPNAGTTPSGTTAPGVTSVNLTGLSPNTAYYFWVRGDCGATQSAWAGSITFFLPPANDLVCGATSLACGQTLAGTTVGAANTGTGEGLVCGISQTMAGVWYVVPGNGQVMTASLCGTAWDSKISVFSGTDCVTLTCVGGVDDNGPACTGTSASFTWTSVVGQNYYILVHGFSANSAFSLALTCTSPPPADPTGITPSNTSICSGAGTNVTLTAAGVVGTVYWFAGSCATTGQIATGNSISVSPSSTTTYFARNFDGLAFSTNCVSYTLTVIPTPTVNAGTGGTICEGNNIQLNATSQTQTNGTLNTTFVAGNGCGAGNMFDLVAGPAQVTVNGFTLNPNSTATQTVNVYYRAGSYVGNTTNVAAWTLLGAYTVNTTAATPVFLATGNIVIPAGATYGIYVQYSANYTDGNGTNQVYSNTDLTLNAGVGHCAAFDGCCSPRVFNGTVHYTVISTPTISWSPAASLSSASILNPVASPTTTTTYTATATNSGCSASSQVTVNVNSASTEPTLSGAGLTCPNTTVNLVASGGIAGTGSQVAWYTGPNGTGTFLGFGNSISYLPTSSSIVYARREGTCNTTADAQTTITLRDFAYAANNISTSTYCTDDAGWNHFYNGNRIILSVRGNLSSAGTVTALIRDNGAYYSDPGNTALCISGVNPGEAQFEMERSWNVSYTGTLSGTYEVRYYFTPQERQDVIDAAAAFIAANPGCAYYYKYNPSNNGWFWFKNNNVAYTAPSYDDNPNFLLLTSTTPGTTSNGTNYTQISGITGFSGGTGGVVLIPGGFLPVEWLYFNVENQGNANRLLWATSSEENTQSYEIQRSVNGLTFERIGTKAAAGNSSVTNYYEFMDNNPQNGLNYYRIKLINTDGTEEFTEIKVIENTFVADFSVYPNPSSDIIHFNSTTDKVEDIKVEILDILGRVVKTEIYKSVNGKNNIPLRISDLQVGAHTLRATFLQSNKTNTAKFVKK